MLATNFRKLKAILTLCFITLLSSCGKCETYYSMTFENTFSTDIEITFRAQNLVRGREPLVFTETLSANESKEITMQILGVNSSSFDDCDDQYRNWPNNIEISNDSLSMYSFCESEPSADDTARIRVIDISSNCKEDESEFVEGY